MKIGMPKQLDITTKTTAGEITTVTFKKPVYSISIENKSSSYTLYASFDMGETWIDIPASAKFPFNGAFLKPFATKGESPIVLLKSDGTSQPARIIYRLVEGE